MEAREKLKRKTNWNFINCNAERIYILGEMKEWSNQYQSIHDLGQYLIWITSVKDITIKLMQNFK